MQHKKSSSFSLPLSSLSLFFLFLFPFLLLSASIRNKPKIIYDVNPNTDIARGFNEALGWRNETGGFATALEEDKPILILITKTNCAACDLLKPLFNSSRVRELAQDFVMIHLQDDEVPPNEPGSKYHPDELDYTPRILFADPDGEIRMDIYNAIGNPSYRFYYFREDQLVGAMKAVLEDTPVPDKPNWELIDPKAAVKAAEEAAARAEAEAKAPPPPPPPPQKCVQLEQSEGKCPLPAEIPEEKCPLFLSTTIPEELLAMGITNGEEPTGEEPKQDQPTLDQPTVDEPTMEDLGMEVDGQVGYEVEVGGEPPKEKDEL